MKMKIIYLIILFVVKTTFALFQSSVREVDTLILLQFLAGISLPFEVDDNSLALGTYMRANYYSTDNATYYTNPTVAFARKMKGGASRWNLYRSFNNFIEKSGFGDGKACLLRTICEIAEIPFEKRTGLFAEILHILLTPSTTSEEIHDYSDIEYYAAEKLGKKNGNCHALYSECGFSLVSTFTKIK